MKKLLLLGVLIIGSLSLRSCVTRQVLPKENAVAVEGIMDLTIAESLAETVEEKANTCLELSSAYWAKYSYANNPQKIHLRQALDYAKKAYSLDQTVDAKQQINDLQNALKDFHTCQEVFSITLIKN